MFGDQNIVDGRYQDLNRVIAINVLDFVRIKAIERYHTVFRLRETKENLDLTDAIEMHFIELPKLLKPRGRSPRSVGCFRLL